jgi:hypothetical protein
MSKKEVWKNINNKNPILTPEYIENTIFPKEIKEFMIKNISWKNKLLEEEVKCEEIFTKG